MSELRRDPVTRKLVIMAKARRRRLLQKQKCPFCEGHEEETPPEIYALRPKASRPNSPGWHVRVIPNKYPALSLEKNFAKISTGLFERLTGSGAHELIVEAPKHVTDFGALPIVQICRVIRVYKARLRALRGEFKYLLLFKNAGAAAGASLTHVHSQLIALPLIPDVVAQELENAAAYYKSRNKCLYCELIRQELKRAERVIEVDKHFVVLAPFASRFPFECHILPRRHSHDFTKLSERQTLSLAQTLKRTLLRLKQALGNPAFNWVLHTALPARANEIKRSFHWRWEILPRTTQPAGLEFGSGIYVNPVAPEEAAEILISADPRSP